MYMQVLQAWRAKEAEESKFLAPASTKSQGTKKKQPVWASATDGPQSFENQNNILSRVRRRLNAARNQLGLSWEHIFVICDKNKDGLISWSDLKCMVRKVLCVPTQALCDTELKTLYNACVKEGGTTLELTDILEFLQHGQSCPELNALRLQKRVDRTRRNIHMAFVNLGKDETDPRKVFENNDMDDSNYLSRYEFDWFMRDDLHLNHWDCTRDDMLTFYDQLDRNGDGIDVTEFLDYVRYAGKTKSKLGGQNLYYREQAEERDAYLHCKARRKRPTYKEVIEGSLRKSESTPVIRLQPPFTREGRDRKPRSRHAATSGSFFL
eukprot:TRINITY_DN102384_c0_g1_i1.p1 TRINITY_DN102384_c0_g1~~TRINITY_DN102384_c0_g1_i1.p1  ORF type:complete len:323 (+),score=43.43 TRINITY_DN102384_c0_g1_i1:123-1091(+)